MIVDAFAKYLQEQDPAASPVSVIPQWLRSVLMKKPENNVEKVVHTEIIMMTNKQGGYLFFAKDESGRRLMDSLYNFALSYDNHKFAKWLHHLKASDFD